jgi:tetratricopeptide (TPR) repeat protein
MRLSICLMTSLENATGRKVSICVLLAGMLFVTGGWAAGRVDQSHQSFIAGLLERRLYPLAAEYCEDQLDRANLTARQRMETIVDLSRTFTEWAIVSPPEQRADRWAQAQRVLDQLTIAEKDNPYLPLARWQAAQVLLAHGKFSRHEAESAGDRERVLETARQQLQHSVTLSGALLLELDRLIEQYHGEPSQGEPSQGSWLSERQLVSLQRDTREGLADALMNQAVCYPKSSPDRINALQRAKDYLKILAVGNHPGRWTNRVRLLRCLRLFGQVDQFHQRAERDLAEHPPADAAAGIHIELARQLVSEEKYGEAIGILDSAPACGNRTQAELDFLELEILLTAAAKATGRTDGDWQQRAIHQVRTIEQQHGHYWMRRAESLLGRHVASTSTSQDIEMLQRAAQGFYRAGQMAEAVAAYDRAATRAMQENLFEQAYQLGHTAAMIEHEQENYRKASERFLKLAREHHNQKMAADSHLMAAYDLAQAMREEPEQGLRDYLALLQEHLRSWPQAATANQARLWLGRVFQAQKQWKQAVDVLFDVDPDSNYFPAAVSAASVCCEQYCGELAEGGDPQLKQQATFVADQIGRAHV